MKCVTGDVLREFREFRKRTGIRDPVVDTFLLMEPPRLQFPEPMDSPVQVKFVCAGHWLQRVSVTGLWFPWGEVPERGNWAGDYVNSMVEEFRRRNANVHDASWEYKKPPMRSLTAKEFREEVTGTFGPK